MNYDFPLHPILLYLSQNNTDFQCFITFLLTNYLFCRIFAFFFEKKNRIK